MLVYMKERFAGQKSPLKPQQDRRKKRVSWMNRQGGKRARTE